MASPINCFILLKVFLLVTFTADVMGQISCPPNIGFENGDFTNWEFANGVIQKADGMIVVTPASPDQSRQKLLDKSIGGTDPFGEFPVTSPNGSRYSLKLGNEEVRAQAERASYTFTIPSSQDQYTLIYYYAVVFQNPNHSPYQQPRFTSKVFNVTEDKYIECGSYEFIANSGLPGFELARYGDDVYFKSWSPVSINLSGYAGKTIRLEFTNNDCSEGGHFGYAYLDMNENCAEPISGNVSCVSNTDLTLQAPPGFMEYQWFTGDFSVQLGKSSSLQFTPPPPANTNFVVRLVPYPGLGCIDTITAVIHYSDAPLDLKMPAEIDGCIIPGIDLTSNRLKTGSTPGLIYTYFADKPLTTFLPAPQHITESGKYFVQAMNTVGCTVAKPVSVVIHPDPSFMVTDPPAVQYPATVNLRFAVQGNGYAYSFWKDENLSTVLPRPDSLNVRGTYFVKALSEFGCITSKPITVTITPSPEAVITAPNAFTPNNDGLNDVFRIFVNDRVKIHQLRIYNRWGQLIFSTTDLAQGWHAEKMPAGTYVWIVEGEDLFNKNKLKKSGQLLLLR